jgi:hypothetical protein
MRRLTPVLATWILIAGCDIYDDEATVDEETSPPLGKADDTAGEASPVCESSADCGDDTYCFRYTVYDWPRCMSLSRVVWYNWCGYGTAPLLVKGTGFEAWDGATVHLAEGSLSGSERGNLHGARVVEDGQFVFDCNAAVEERYDYPSLHLWIDTDGDGRCNQEHDFVSASIFYGFGAAGVELAVDSASHDSGAPTCRVFHELAAALEVDASPLR